MIGPKNERLLLYLTTGQGTKATRQIAREQGLETRQGNVTRVGEAVRDTLRDERDRLGSGT